MELKYLRLIKTIAEEGNISNSANRLFLTQSALSHQLKDIESRLGFKVFLRSRNKWKLTEEGLALYQIAKNVLTEIEQGMDKINEIRSGARGVVRVSTECYSFYHGLPSFLQKMQILYPHVEVRLMVEATHQPVTKLESGDLDIAITTSKENGERLKFIPIFKDEIFAIAHREHPTSDKKYLEANDFKDIHFIIHSYPLDTVSVYRLFLKPAKVMPQKITAIPLTEIALEMVHANMGIMCMPEWALASFTIPNTLTKRPIGKKGLKRTHYAAVKTEDLNKKYIRDFVQNLTEAYAEPNHGYTA